MECKLITKNILHKLGTNKRYAGYDYIIYGIKLISQNEMLMSNVTKILYADIAKEFNTTTSCVERNIRNAINAIWRNINNDNLVLLSAIFGDRYVAKKPTNKVFLELLYEYVKQNGLLNDLFTMDYKCPFHNKNCIMYNEIARQLLEL